MTSRLRHLALLALLAGCATVKTAPSPVAEPVSATPPPSVPAPAPVTESTPAPSGARDPVQAAALLERGRTVQREKGEGGAADAIALYRQALAADPQNTAALWEIGWSEQLRGRHEAALEAWTQLRAIDAAYPELAEHYPELTERVRQLRLLDALPDPGPLPPRDEVPTAGSALTVAAVGDVQLGMAWPPGHVALPPDDARDVFDGVKATATGYSPDVKSAEASVQQGVSEIGVARGGVLPSLSFDYFYGINANQFAITNPDGLRLLGSVVQAQVNVPLWNWGAAQSKLRQAELRVQAARADLTLAQRQLLANVSAFHREAAIARDQVTSLRASLDLATESLRLTLLRYQAGEVSVLEVVDAQTTLIQARNAYDDGLVRYRVALAALQTLTGTL